MKQLVPHFWSLTTGTARTWARYFPWLIGFTLFAWAGEYASLLASSVVAAYQAYLVIVGLSIGLILQLTMLVLALRKVGSLVGWTAEPPVPIRQIVDMALLPFLAIYMGFGLVNDYVSNLFFLIQGRMGFFQVSEVMAALNPAQSRTRLIWVLVTLVVLYAVSLLLDVVKSKVTAIWPDLLDTFITAFGTFLGVLSVFRIWEQVRLWIYTRNIAAWRDEFMDWLTSVFHFNVPDFLSQVWSYFSETVWPSFWDMLLQPLVWFALAVLVAGGKFIHVDEIVTRVVPPADNKVVGFLRDVVQDRILGDLDEKLFPVFQALRRMWKATISFLAAYILAFTALTWIGEALQDLAWRLIGMRQSSTIAIAIPLVDAISAVLILSLKLALLIVAFSQAEKLAENPTEAKTSVTNGILVVLVCCALAVAHTVTAPSSTTIHSGDLGQSVSVTGVQLSVSDIRVGTEVSSGMSGDTTDQRFVVVHLSSVSEKVHASFRATLIVSGHTYVPYDENDTIMADPGFLTETDVIFEVNRSDFGQPFSVQLKPVVYLVSQVEVAQFSFTLDPTGSQDRTVSANTLSTQSVP